MKHYTKTGYYIINGNYIYACCLKEDIPKEFNVNKLPMINPGIYEWFGQC